MSNMFRVIKRLTKQSDLLSSPDKEASKLEFWNSITEQIARVFLPQAHMQLRTLLQTVFPSLRTKIVKMRQRRQ